MKENLFNIYIDRLRHGETEKIFIKTKPDFLDINEKELRFCQPVEISGEAYLANTDLVLHLAIHTVAELPCSICNETTSYPVEIKNFYFTKPLDEISSHIFDFSVEVREAILLEVPFVVECCGGKCPSRKEIAEYLAPPIKKSEDDGWQPFKDL